MFEAPAEQFAVAEVLHHVFKVKVQVVAPVTVVSGVKVPVSTPADVIEWKVTAPIPAVGAWKRSYESTNVTTELTGIGFRETEKKSTHVSV